MHTYIKGEVCARRESFRLPCTACANDYSISDMYASVRFHDHQREKQNIKMKSSMKKKPAQVVLLINY